jgi:hypothetical protein
VLVEEKDGFKSIGFEFLKADTPAKPTSGSSDDDDGGGPPPKPKRGPRKPSKGKAVAKRPGTSPVPKVPLGLR